MFMENCGFDNVYYFGTAMPVRKGFVGAALIIAAIIIVDVKVKCFR